jgi:amino acid adenylation domain-containing protein/thioester reductase-like protein
LMAESSPQLAALSPEEKRTLLAQLLRKKAQQSRSFPLSFAQERLWFLDQLEPANPVYNLSAAFRLKTSINAEILQQSINAIVQRHAILRTTFTAGEGRPMQVVTPTAVLAVSVVDLRDLPAIERESCLQRVVAEDARTPFDLTHGPLLRVTLLQVKDEEHVLLVTMHHIISDGWSIEVFLREGLFLYEAFCTGQSSPLPPLSLQYADFAVWQRQWLQGEALEAQLAYWRHQLAGTPSVLALPTDRPRPAVQTFRGARYPVLLSKPLTEALTALSRRTGGTLFMTLLAAFAALLYRYTGQHDIVIGSPIANRSRAELEELIGFFVNTLALRLDLSGDPSFLELLRRAREVCLGAYAHQDLPFEKLVEELQPARNLSHNPLVQVMLVLQNTPLSTLAGTEGTLDLVEIPRETAAFDLTLNLWERPEGLCGWCEYNTALFNVDTIARMMSHLEILLRNVTAQPQHPLSALSLLTRTEYQQVLVEWNATTVDYPKNTCLQELFEAQVERTPEALALVYEGTHLSYRELNQRANQVAHYLRRLGVGPEVLVGLCMERSLEMVVGLFGILKAGGAYVPLDPEYPKDRVAFMLEDAQVSVLLTQEHLGVALPSHTATPVCLDSEWEAIAQEREENPCREATADNLAYVIYTSGSTGKPKGVMISHRGICNRLLWMQETYRLSERDRVLQKTPFSFDVSVWEFFWPLLNGAGLVMARPGGHRESAYLVKLIAEQQVSTLHFVPPMLQVFLGEPGLETCACLKRVICSGEALPFELQERFFARLSAELHNLYGPTEASVDVTFWACERESERRLVPIGRPIANTQIYILDSRLAPVPVGVPGELHIGGIGLARGYLSRPDLTAEKFIPDPFANAVGTRLYKTGDLARWLPDGNIEFLGRIDHQVKIRGFRIELEEIEAILSQHPAVASAVVLAQDNEADNKRLVAYVVPQPEQALTSSALRGFLKEKLPDYMVPSAFVLLEALPLSPNGKVNRQALPLPALARPSLEQPFVAPRTPTEKTLAGIWAEVLGIERVGIHDDFFELGGHSLLTTQVAFRTRQAFQAEFPLHCLFEAPTVSGLAQVIDRILLSGSVMTGPMMTIADLKVDATLDPSIRPAITPSELGTEPAHVFLTGATGFLGAFLLHELLRQTQADIYCLVRASSPAEGAKSLQRTLELYSLWNAPLSSRIIPVVGDLARPLLGLSAEQFQSLAAKIDVVYHNGALVNFIYPYSALKATNVLGTQEILRLASHHHVKPVHFISTLSVFLSSDALAGTVVREDDNLNEGARLYGGYAQSKWVAEQLVMIARSRGIPVCIYRPGLIAGHSQTGVWNTNDFASRVIQSCIQLGSVPDLDTTVDLVSVDYVSRAIVYLSRQHTSLGKAFHFANPQPVPVNDLVQWLRACGYPLRQMSYEQWYTALTIDDGWKRTLLPFLLPKQIPIEQLHPPKIDCRNTVSGLAESDLACPLVDVSLLQTYLSYFKRSGFLAAVQTNRELGTP